MIAELDGTNQITRLYTYNPQSMEPVSTAIGCTAYFYITDHLMTPQMLTSISGTTVWYAQYSAFGVANVITDTVTNNLRFPGQYADAESGLYYNYARYYLPSIGRYIQPDILTIAAIETHLTPSFTRFFLVQYLGQQPISQHPYIYVFNNPINSNDPEAYLPGGYIGALVCLVPAIVNLVEWLLYTPPPPPKCPPPKPAPKYPQWQMPHPPSPAGCEYSTPPPPPPPEPHMPPNQE